MPDLTVYTVREVADVLRVHEQAVMYEICQSKRLKAFKIGKEWRITGEALSEFVRQEVTDAS